MQITQEQLFDIHYSMLSEPGDALAGILYRELGARRAIEQLLEGGVEERWLQLLESIGAYEYLGHIPATIERFRLRLKHFDPERAVEQQLRFGGRVLILRNHDSISKLYEPLGVHAPLVLWIRGNAEVLSAPSVSIVGTREATRSGVTFTQQVVRQVAHRFAIISGGARGIDTAAHYAAFALRAQTVAYMAGGLARLYPRENAKLFEQIVDNGVLVSECAPEVDPTKWRFLQRNRLIASHGLMTLVVEAAMRSGARNTAGHAFACGKPVFARPGHAALPSSQGCNQLIADGIAQPISNPAELPALLAGNSEAGRLSGFTSNETRVLDALSRFPRALERICLDSGLSGAEALATLGSLAKCRIAFRTPRGWMLG